jgi:hypothetical protein
LKKNLTFCVFIWKKLSKDFFLSKLFSPISKSFLGGGAESWL